MYNAQQTVASALEEIVRRYAPKNRAALPLTPQTHLTDDAGIDSPRMIDIVLGVEDRFGITVEDAKGATTPTPPIMMSGQ